MCVYIYIYINIKAKQPTVNIRHSPATEDRTCREPRTRMFENQDWQNL